jgi:hypothetical protein
LASWFISNKYHQKPCKPSAFIRRRMRTALASHALCAKMGVAVGPPGPDFLTAKQRRDNSEDNKTPEEAPWREG